LLSVLCFLMGAMVGSTQCTNTQLGGEPCIYSTSDCLKGLVQWNYPTKTCEWTFSPSGASSVQMSAYWATAKYVNLTFFDGVDPVKAKRLAFVVGGEDLDEQKLNVTSTTGVIYVKLQGPPSTLTYGLMFNYVLKTTTDQCSINDGDCAKCVAAGCSMFGTGSSCVSACPMDVPCYSASQLSQVSVCATRQAALDKSLMCSSQTSCASCLSNQCLWGGMAGAAPSCGAGCQPMQRCEFLDICPSAVAVTDNCSAHSTCETCIDAGCSLIGLNRLNCVQECPSDMPCFAPDRAKKSTEICQDRQTLVYKTALCKSKNTSCSDCLAAECSWNTKGAQGRQCITACGFFCL